MLLGVAAFVAGGVWLERSEHFAAARSTLRGQSGPAGIPDDGSVGRVLAEVTRRVGVRGVLGAAPPELPSSLVVPDRYLQGPLPVLSIAVDEDHLLDPETGIIANARRTGREWERLAWVSLWEDGAWRTGSRAGLRIHGDSSRYLGRLSYRLHFRRMYGTSPEVGGRLLGTDAPPAAAVVVRIVHPPGLYANLFAFEIGQRIGSVVPRFRPARLLINGAGKGVFLLTERVMASGWGVGRFGHQDFDMYVFKGDTDPRSERSYQDLESWVLESGSLSLEEVSRRVDVDNLTRHLLTDMFCYVTDWAQGAAFRDRSDPEARWRWIHWDTDLAFDRQGIVDVVPWDQPVTELVTLDAGHEELQAHGIVTDERHTRRHAGDLRRLLFLRLLEDPAYRRLLARTVADTLNHRLTPDYFDGLLARWRHLSGPDGTWGGFDMATFLARRPAVVRREIGRLLELEPPVPVTVDLAADTSWEIDGVPGQGPYRGLYYPGQTATIRVTDLPPGTRLAAWRLDGTSVPATAAARLEHVVESSVTIGPVLEPAGSR